MIKDMIEFGEWLNENEQDNLWKDVNNEDIIFPVYFKDDDFVLSDLTKKENLDLPYFDKSMYHQDLFFSSDQKFTIADQSCLMGLTPFFISLNQKFVSKTDLKK